MSLTVRAAGTAAAPVITWARTFPAVPAQVREARRFLAGLLDGGPATDDAVLCLSELVSNATQHSRSSQPGGVFTVRARLDGADLRVEVADAGGPWSGPADAAPPPASHQRGRGLTIVTALTRSWGVSDTSDGGRVVWFDLTLPPASPTT
jgi:serine/threonine-protein kinase RsbW